MISVEHRGEEERERRKELNMGGEKDKDGEVQV